MQLIINSDIKNLDDLVLAQRCAVVSANSWEPDWSQNAIVTFADFICSVKKTKRGFSVKVWDKEN